MSQLQWRMRERQIRSQSSLQVELGLVLGHFNFTFICLFFSFVSSCQEFSGDPVKKLAATIDLRAVNPEPVTIPPGEFLLRGCKTCTNFR